MGDFPFTNRQRRWWFAQLDESSTPKQRVDAESRDRGIEAILSSTNFYRGVYFGSRDHMQPIADRFGGSVEEFKRSGFKFSAVRVNGVLLGPDETGKRGTIKRFR